MVAVIGIHEIKQMTRDNLSVKYNTQDGHVSGNVKLFLVKNDTLYPHFQNLTFLFIAFKLF
jgi:hypothetical protein